MIADYSTRRCSSINEIRQDSTWINGFSWMQNDESESPTLTIDNISLNAKDLQNIKKESKEAITHDARCYIKVSNEISDKYKFSNYIIDPNLYRFKSVVRILAMVMKFISNFRKGGSTINPVNANQLKFIFIQMMKSKNLKIIFSRELLMKLNSFSNPQSTERYLVANKMTFYSTLDVYCQQMRFPLLVTQLES